MTSLNEKTHSVSRGFLRYLLSLVVCFRSDVPEPSLTILDVIDLSVNHYTN